VTDERGFELVPDEAFRKSNQIDDVKRQRLAVELALDRC